ncbi:MAG: Flp family type IVb pilin [Comamonas sp.]|nr:Flp family type IVb pilin [Candidatus Comamonas equi]
MKKLIRNFWRDEAGATAIEYGLIAGLIAVVIAVGATALGEGLNTTFCNIVAKLSTAGNTLATCAK